MSDSFKTIKAPATGLYKEKGSKFLSFIYPVENEAEVQEMVNQLKKTYHDARHHCYAYVLGKEMDYFRANDDGEPHHSAGDPILGQLRSNELTQSLIVVVRYFGGTKLGKGGLVQAYKTAAAEAIASGEIITKTLTTALTITFDYEAMDQVMHTISRHELKIAHQDFGNSCRIQLECRENLREELKALFKGIPSLKILT
ncbi:YigZ family protein [Cyclobacterium sp.]|uniref:IMPACT family protein n=1 Tax=Cyclobacterium sp. TaxID=1966343 RepID=UPI0019BA705C|nr:YigZ family protein [Cyclobacterium sp.]MBD3628122.1 YigZ family protein [Cyclobacterium sp.]